MQGFACDGRHHRAIERQQLEGHPSDRAEHPTWSQHAQRLGQHLGLVGRERKGVGGRHDIDRARVD
jgi:hypothetical protein